MLLSNHIQNLLFFHDCVIVPDFGAFITIREEASLNPNTDIFLPPKRSILFNRSLKNDDGLLLGHLAKTLDLGYEQVATMVREQVIEWENNLKSDQKLIIQGLGDIVIDLNGSWKFIPKKTENYLSDAYGLFAFHSKAVDTEKDKSFAEETSNQKPYVANYKNSSHEEAFQSLNKDEPQTEQFKSSNRTKSRVIPRKSSQIFQQSDNTWGLFKYAFIGFVIVAIVVFSYVNTQSSKGQLFQGKFSPFGSISELNDYSQIHFAPEEIRMSEQIVNYQLFKDVITDIQYKMKTGAFRKGQIDNYSIVGRKLTSDNKTSNNNKRKKVSAVGGNKIMTVISGNYFIIEGAYLDYYNANARVRLLRNQGYSSATIAGKTRLGQHRVAFGAYGSKAEATENLNEIKRIKPTAWIYSTQR